MFRGVRVLGTFLFLLLLLYVYKFPRSFRGFSLNSFLYLRLLCSDLCSMLLYKCLSYLQELSRLK